MLYRKSKLRKLRSTTAKQQKRHNQKAGQGQAPGSGAQGPGEGIDTEYSADDIELVRLLNNIISMVPNNKIRLKTADKVALGNKLCVCTAFAIDALDIVMKNLNIYKQQQCQTAIKTLKKGMYQLLQAVPTLQ